MVTYNSWPLGHVPEHLRRPELEEIKKLGYVYSDARDVVNLFEEEVAMFTGSGYAVAVDCCTHALELCLRYKLASGELDLGDDVFIPDHTYISVPMMVKRVGLNPLFWHDKWEGYYQLRCKGKTNLYDAAVMWQRDFYIKGSLMCLSFQIKKRIPIGRGGMILTDNQDIAELLKKWRYDGRDMSIPYDNVNHIQSFGFHYYMTPEDAARGLLLMHEIKETGSSGGWNNYPNLRQWEKYL